jgi:hypothetical protein
VIEDPGSQTTEHTEIAGPQYPDRDAHRATTAAAAG